MLFSRWKGGTNLTIQSFFWTKGMLYFFFWIFGGSYLGAKTVLIFLGPFFIVILVKMFLFIFLLQLVLSCFLGPLSIVNCLLSDGNNLVVWDGLCFCSIYAVDGSILRTNSLLFLCFLSPFFFPAVGSCYCRMHWTDGSDWDILEPLLCMAMNWYFTYCCCFFCSANVVTIWQWNGIRFSLGLI